MRPGYAIVAGLGLALACGAPAADARTCAGARTMAAPDGPAVNCLINALRVRHGLRPLAGGHRLALAGHRHAADMVRRRYFSHSSPDGTSFVTRIARTGYLRGAAAWCVGEVLAYGSDSASSPEELVRAWMDSPPHRAVLLTRGYRRLGVGIAPGQPVGGGEDGFTVAVEFGAKGAC